MSAGLDAARGQGSTVAALVGKSITSVVAWTHGVVHVTEVNFTGGPYYVKWKQGRCEIGGTAEWDTGTVITS
jgi:hypothetical protein